MDPLPHRLRIPPVGFPISACQKTKVSDTQRQQPGHHGTHRHAGQHIALGPDQFRFAAFGRLGAEAMDGHRNAIARHDDIDDVVRTIKPVAR